MPQQLRKTLETASFYNPFIADHGISGATVCASFCVNLSLFEFYVFFFTSGEIKLVPNSIRCETVNAMSKPDEEVQVQQDLTSW